MVEAPGLPGKHRTDSSETPETEHIEVAIFFKRFGQNFPSKFRRDCGNDIKG